MIQILIEISNNKDIQNSAFQMNLAIIYISEKTFYQHEHNPFYKRYLCKIISELNPNIKFFQQIINNSIQYSAILIVISLIYKKELYKFISLLFLNL